MEPVQPQADRVAAENDRPKKNPRKQVHTYKDSLSDPGAIQTHDLQNRNLTLYSLSYGAVINGAKVGNKSKRS